MWDFIEKKIEWFIEDVLGPKLSFILGVVLYYFMFSYLVYSSLQEIGVFNGFEVNQIEEAGGIFKITLGILMMVMPPLFWYWINKCPSTSDYIEPDTSGHPARCQCWDCHPWG